MIIAITLSVFSSSYEYKFQVPVAPFQAEDAFFLPGDLLVKQTEALAIIFPIK